MPLEDMAIDVRKTLALWLVEGLSVREMCDALGVPPPSIDSNQLRYVEQRALSRWLAMGVDEREAA